MDFLFLLVVSTLVKRIYSLLHLRDRHSWFLLPPW